MDESEIIRQLMQYVRINYQVLQECRLSLQYEKNLYDGQEVHLDQL